MKDGKGVLCQYYRSLPAKETIDFSKEVDCCIQVFKQTNNPKALHRIWDLVARWVHWYLRNNPNIRRGYEIDDLVGDAFIALEGVVRAYEPEKGKFLTYYARSIHNMIFQRWSHDSRHNVEGCQINEEVLGLFSDIMSREELEKLHKSIQIDDPIDRLLWVYLEIYMNSEGRSSMGKIAGMAGMTAKEVARTIPAAIQRFISYYPM